MVYRLSHLGEFRGALTLSPAENRGRARNGKLVEISGCVVDAGGERDWSYRELKARRTCGNYPKSCFPFLFHFVGFLSSSVDCVCAFYRLGASDVADS